MSSVFTWRYFLQVMNPMCLNRRRLKAGFSILLCATALMMAFLYLAELSKQVGGYETIPFSFTADPASRLNIYHANELLKDASEQKSLRNELREYPYWIRFSPGKLTKGYDRSLEIASRHIANMTCWQIQGNHIQELGRIVQGNSHQFEYQKSAWLIDLSNYSPYLDYVCKMEFVGPAQLSLHLWDPSLLQQEIYRFERKIGFLEGGLTLLTGLVAVAALLTRSRVFIYYGIWLIASLRVAALSGGWDTQWFGITLSQGVLLKSRMLALWLYYTTSTFLISSLFENVKRQPVKYIWRGVQISCIFLLLFAIFAPYKIFLMVLWPTILIASTIAIAVILQNAIQKRDTVAIYYLLSMVITLLGSVSEVLAAWLEIKTLVQYLNSSSITLAASLMAAISVAESLRNAQQQQNLAAKQVRIAHERLSSVFNIAPSAMFSADPQGKLLDFNKRFENSFLFANLNPIYDFLYPSSLAESFKKLEFAGNSIREEFRGAFEDGQPRWYEMTLSRDEKDIVGVVSDITAQKDRESSLHFQATHDELTGALNRRGLEACISNQMDKGVPVFNFFHTDIKRFRYINRAYGMSMADRLLQSFYSELFRYMCMFGDIARVQLDQFIIIIHDNEWDEAKRSFGRFLDRVKTSPLSIEQRQVSIEMTACFIQLKNINNLSESIDTLDATLREARICRSRQHDESQLEFSVEQTQKFLDQARMVNRLGLHKLPEGLTLVWQPIMSMNAPDRHLYAEVLLRQKGADGQLRSAGHVIDACLSNGHSSLLDSWVLGSTLAWVSKNRSQLEHLNAISINISPSSLNDEHFLADTLDLLHHHENIIQKICLEITEVGSVVNLQAVGYFIERIRAMGVRIALDDFGAGYSNFRYAIDLHADVIKIDGSIISDICKSPESMAVAKAIVSLSHDLGCKCVAEWVEDEHTLAALHDLSVDYIQGFIISPAIHPERFLALHSVADLIEDEPTAQLIESLIERPLIKSKILVSSGESL